MFDISKRPKLVGTYIRQRREALGLSQRALGMLFNPPVTTQFISNVERGVTPLPPAHVSVLSKALNAGETELMALLEKEYTVKLSGRLGRTAGPVDPWSMTGTSATPATDDPRIEKELKASGSMTHLTVSIADYPFMKSLYESYLRADLKTRQSFLSACQATLKLPIHSLSLPGERTSGSVGPKEE